MKSFFFPPPLISLLFSGVLLGDQDTAGYGIQYLPSKILESATDVTTDAALLARQKSEKFGGLRAKADEFEGYDLSRYSTFIQIGESYTLVPKGAVLNLPEKFAAAIVTQPVGRFVAWQEFQATNRGSLSNLEITLEQAAGKVPIDPAKLDAAKKAGVLLVAVIRGGAVSVASNS